MGMLQDNSTQPGSGPVGQTPPGQAPLTDDPAGSGQPAEMQPNDPKVVEELFDKGATFLYKERYDPMLKMFRTNGPDGFARSIGLAINTTLKELEKEGPLDLPMAIEVSMELYAMLINDIVMAEDVLPGLELAQVNQALPAMLEMYEQSHPEIEKGTMQKLYDEIRRQSAHAVKDNPVMQQATGATPEPEKASPGATGEASPELKPMPTQQTPTSGAY